MSLGVPGVTLPPIPGDVAFFPVESWQEPGRYTVSGPAFPSPGDIVVVFIHYPGGGTAPRTVAEMHARMRSMQRGYIDRRGYSIGYGFVTPPFGGAWEGRGVRFRNAANAGDKVPGNANYWSVAIQCMVTGVSAATDAQLYTAAAVIQWLRDLGMQVVIGYHAQVDPTPCAGSPIIDQVHAGEFEPARWGLDEGKDAMEIRRIELPPDGPVQLRETDSTTRTVTFDPFAWPWLAVWDDGHRTPVIDEPIDGLPQARIDDANRYLNAARSAGVAAPLPAP